MKQSFLLVLCLLCCVIVRAQDPVLKKFTIEAFPQIPEDSSLRYYYVLNEARPPKVPDYFLNIIPEIDTLKVPVKQFLNCRDTSTLKWTSYPVNKIRYVDRDHLPRYRVGFRRVPLSTTTSQLDSMELHGTIGIRGDTGMSEKKFMRLIRRKSTIYYKKPLEEQNYYVISRPVFTADKRYALVTVEENMRGFALIFALENNVWKLLTKTNFWME